MLQGRFSRVVGPGTSGSKPHFALMSFSFVGIFKTSPAKLHEQLGVEPISLIFFCILQVFDSVGFATPRIFSANFAVFGI